MWIGLGLGVCVGVGLGMCGCGYVCGCGCGCECGWGCGCGWMWVCCVVCVHFICGGGRENDCIYTWLRIISRFSNLGQAAHNIEKSYGGAVQFGGAGGQCQWVGLQVVDGIARAGGQRKMKRRVLSASPSLFPQPHPSNTCSEAVCPHFPDIFLH